VRRLNEITGHGVVFGERVDHDRRALSIVETEGAGFFGLETDPVVKLVADVPNSFSAAQGAQLAGLIYFEEIRVQVYRHSLTWHEEAKYEYEKDRSRISTTKQIR